MANPLLYLGLGAGLMFLMDPQNGRRRRNNLARQAEAIRRKAQHGRDMVVRDATNRTHGLLMETRQAIEARRNGRRGPTLAQVIDAAAASWGRERWSPAQRALGGAAGAALAMVGYLRGGVRGMAMCAAGGALVARASANERLGVLMKSRDIPVEKTMRDRAASA